MPSIMLDEEAGGEKRQVFWNVNLCAAEVVFYEVVSHCLSCMHLKADSLMTLCQQVRWKSRAS